MKILYICTHNRCRSILSEAVTNHRAGDVLTARSAGSQPAGEVHPLTLVHLAEAGISTTGLKSQSWDDFEAFAPDVVITLCDSAAGESCPVWFGQAIKVHWGLKDPSKLDGEAAAEAFRDTLRIIERRVDGLAAIAHMDRHQWPDAIRALVADA